MRKWIQQERVDNFFLYLTPSVRAGVVKVGESVCPVGLRPLHNVTPPKIQIIHERTPAPIKAETPNPWSNLIDSPVFTL